MGTFSQPQKILLAAGAVLVLGGVYYALTTLGATTMGLTLDSNPDLENGLVLHYTFDGPDVDWSSTTAEILDSSGNGNNGNATTTMTATSSPVSGVLGQALQFNGVDDYVAIAAYSTLDFPNGDDDLTFSAWVKLRTCDTSGSKIIEKSDGGSSAITLECNSSNKAKFGVYLNAGSRSIVGSTNLNDNQWHFVTGTKIGNNVYVYVDGVQENTGVGSFGSGWTGQPYRIGSSVDGANREVDGAIDDVRIYNRALSATEIKRLYELGATTHIAQTLSTNPDLSNGLVGHWTFDGEDMDWGSSTAEVQDVSGNGNDGDYYDPSAGPTVTEGVVGQAGYFDGINQYVKRADAALIGAFPSKSSGGATDFSVSAWAYFVDYVGRSTIVSKQQTGTIVRGFLLAKATQGDGNDIEFEVAKDNTTTTNLQTGTAISLNEWHHITGTYEYVADGTSIMRIYIDGEEITSTTTAVGPPNANSIELAIGNYKGDSAFPMKGGLDDVRVYNRALSAEEVKRLYGLGATTHVAKTITTNPDLENGLVGHWTFDGADVDWGSSTAEILDRSVYENHANATRTMSNAETSVMGVIGQGAYFDGNQDCAIVDDSVELRPTGALTYAGWVNGNPNIALSGVYTFIGKAQGGGYFIYLYGSGGSSCTGITSSAFCGGVRIDGVYRAVKYNGVVLGEWYHTAMTYDGTDVKLYVNGELSETLNYPGTISQVTNPFVMGADAGNPAVSGICEDEFRGNLDDVRVYNRALSAAEVKRLYQMGE